MAPAKEFKELRFSEGILPNNSAIITLPRPWAIRSNSESNFSPGLLMK